MNEAKDQRYNDPDDRQRQQQTPENEGKHKALILFGLSSDENWELNIEQ
jgi:hypothetical protein